MIYNELKKWREVPGFSSHPIWRAALEWLENTAVTAGEGQHPLGATGFFARVMSYELKDRSVARYELHRQTIDVQYTISGAEAIELAALPDLVPLNDYALEKDVEHFATPPRGCGGVDNLAGKFTVLFPGEAHMPQLRVPGFSVVRKVVVKIPQALIG